MSDPHPSTQHVGYLSAGEMLNALASGNLTSESVVMAILDRIAALDPVSSTTALQAIAGVNESAVTLARTLDAERARGELRGPLHGLPVMIKDNIEAMGLPALAGSTALRGRPTRDAALVTSLRAAGAIVLASTNLSAWANIRSPKSTSGWSATGGLVANPWSLAHSAGGSSAGAGAAAAAGYGPLFVGTETDGSITCPASLNGVAGLKPTVGSVSRDYVIPIAGSQDTPGAMGRRVADVALLHAVIAREPLVTPTHIRWADVRNWRTGHAPTDALFEEVTVDLRGDRDVASLTAHETTEEVQRDELTVLLSELRDDLSAYLADRPGDGVQSLADVVAFENERADVEMPYFGHEFFDQALATGGRASAEYREARARNIAWAKACLEELTASADVLLTPAYGPAWLSTLGEGDNFVGGSNAIGAAAIAGWPIMTIPMGLIEGLPVGISLVGRPHNEGTLLAAAAELEAVIDRPGLGAPQWRSR